MPCYDAQAAGESAAARESIDHLTRLLCTACKLLLDAGRLRDDPDLQRWWAQHQQNLGHQQDIIDQVARHLAFRNPFDVED
jgi:hypothetical protein